MEDFIIGRNAVKEALRGDRIIQRVLVSDERGIKGLGEIIKKAKDKGIEVRKTPQQKLNKYGNNHQGVVALVAKACFTTLDEALMAETKTPLLIILDGIEDPHNMGAIIRTAECVGASAVLIPKRHSAPINSTVAKTSAGAIEHVSLVEIGNVSQTIKMLKKAGFWVLGAAMEGEQTLYESDMTVPTVLVIGNEGKGISRLVKEQCDYLVQIPMLGKLNSLNASVAAAILMYEVVRQRSEKHE